MCHGQIGVERTDLADNLRSLLWPFLSSFYFVLLQHQLVLTPARLTMVTASATALPTVPSFSLAVTLVTFLLATRLPGVFMMANTRNGRRVCRAANVSFHDEWQSLNLADYFFTHNSWPQSLTMTLALCGSIGEQYFSQYYSYASFCCKQELDVFLECCEFM